MKIAVLGAGRVGSTVGRLWQPTWESAHGTYAEYTAVAPWVKTEPLARIPDGVTDEQAAALPIAAITALRSLELLDVTPGQRLVVMGATGGVGGYTVQMARDRGVHVIATVRGDVDEARRIGAEEVYDAEAVDVVDALRTSHPDGVEAVLDLVNGSDVICRDAEILKPGGGLVSTRYAADKEWFADARSPHSILLQSRIHCPLRRDWLRLRACSRTARSPRAFTPLFSRTT